MKLRIWRPPRAHRARFADRTSATCDDLLSQQIDELELAMRREDPAFVRRYRRLQRCETVRLLATFAFVASGAVLITFGLAMASVVTGVLGIIAMVCACLFDHRLRRALRRSSHHADAP